MRRRYAGICAAVLLAILLICFTTVSGCSPFYVMRAAYEESKILLAREDIEELIQSGELDPKTQEKLNYVLLARAYAESLSMQAGESYTMYSKVDRETLAWVLLASRKTAFDLHTWWYPMVGSVPYKGYFEKEDAQCDVRRLERKGYEVWLRETDAFSTLGWFNDPVLSTTLQHPTTSIVNTVIHEIFHANVWIPNSVDFNESAANFVGSEASVHFFKERLEECQDDEACKTDRATLLEEAERARDLEYELSTILTQLFEELSTLYDSNSGEENILAERTKVFERVMLPIYDRYPTIRILRTPNNAEIMQLYLYRKELELFRELFTQCGEEWECFFTKLREIAESEGDPFEATKDIISPF